MPSDEGKCTAEDFVREALNAFPQLTGAFQFDEGLPHVQMSHFASLTQEAKDSGDWRLYGRCVALADKLWGCADDYLENALNVSYLEEIDFRGANGDRAWSMLSPRLQKAWKEMQKYLTDLAAAAERLEREEKRKR